MLCTNGCGATADEKYAALAKEHNDLLWRLDFGTPIAHWVVDNAVRLTAVRTHTDPAFVEQLRTRRRAQDPAPGVDVDILPPLSASTSTDDVAASVHTDATEPPPPAGPTEAGSASPSLPARPDPHTVLIPRWRLYQTAAAAATTTPPLDAATRLRTARSLSSGSSEEPVPKD